MADDREKHHRLIRVLPFVFVELNKAGIIDWVFKKSKNDPNAYDCFSCVGTDARGPHAYVRVDWHDGVQEPS